MTHPRSSRLLVALLPLAVVACERQPPSPTVTEREPAITSTAPRQVAPASACAPLEELAAMDTRRPVPLQPMMAWHQKQNMMEHLVAIQRITDALAREDWDGVTAGAALIASSPQMQQMCQHMGAGADGFTELALEFHRRADAIAPAAEAQDGAAVLRATSHTLEACTSCHATYRQDVVDAPTWQAKSGSDHDPARMHGH